MAGALNDAERKFVEGLLETHSQTELFSGKLEVKSKKKTKDQILLIASNRIHLIAAGKPKVKVEIHILDLEEISSGTPRELTIKGKKKEKEKEGSVISVVNLLESVSNSIIQKLYLCIKLAFPNMPINVFPKFLVIPEERIGKDKYSEEDVSPCGGYARAYSCVCDWLGIEPCEDIVWDINIIYPLNHIEKFDISEMSLRKARLTPGDVRALMHALKYNDHFSSIQAANYKLDASLNYISDTLLSNASIEKLVLATVGMTKDMAITLANSLTGAGLYHLDISGNTIEDKGMNAIASALSTFRKGMLTLNVAKTCGKAGISTLMKALEGNPQIYQTLENLSLAGNKLDEAVSKEIGSFFSRAQSLKRINLSGTSVSFQYLATRRLESISLLDASGNKVCASKESHLELVRFLQHCPNLQELLLNNTGIEVDALRVIFGNTTSIVPSVEILDISDNDLGDAGIIAFFEALGNRHRIKRLKMNRNWIKPSKQRAQAVQSLIQFVNSEQCTLENLVMCGAAKNHSQLKEDILPFVFCLMTNNKLTVVDISGHQAGNSIGLALCKVLSINRTLQGIHIDDNGLGTAGFRVLQLGLERNKNLKKIVFPITDASSAIQTNDGERARDILHKIQNRLMKNLLGDVDKNLSSSYSTESLRSRSSSNVSRNLRPKRVNRRSVNIDPGRATYIFKEAPVFDME